MRDENVKQVNQMSNVEEYLSKNPNDNITLLYSAYNDDLARWQETIKVSNEKVKSNNTLIVQLTDQLNNITKFQNFYRKLFRLKGHKKYIQQKINDLLEENKRLDNEFISLVNNRPAEWQYQLAAFGNLFSSRK